MMENRPAILWRQNWNEGERRLLGRWVFPHFVCENGFRSIYTSRNSSQCRLLNTHRIYSIPGICQSRLKSRLPSKSQVCRTCSSEHRPRSDGMAGRPLCSTSWYSISEEVRGVPTVTPSHQTSGSAQPGMHSCQSECSQTLPADTSNQQKQNKHSSVKCNKTHSSTD